MRYPEERALYVLVGRDLVHMGALSVLSALRASGHQVTLDGDAVRVERHDLDEGVSALLDALEEDVVMLLRVEPGATIS